MCVCFYIVGAHGKTWDLKWMWLGVYWLCGFYEMVGMVYVVVVGL